MNEFLALIAQARAVSQSHFPSSLIFSNVSVRMQLCLSQRPLLHGEYEGVVVNVMLKFSHVFEFLRFKFSSIVTENFVWAAKYTYPRLQEFLNDS